MAKIDRGEVEVAGEDAEKVLYLREHGLRFFVPAIGLALSFSLVGLMFVAIETGAIS